METAQTETRYGLKYASVMHALSSCNMGWRRGHSELKLLTRTYLPIPRPLPAASGLASRAARMVAMMRACSGVGCSRHQALADLHVKQRMDLLAIWIISVRPVTSSRRRAPVVRKHQASSRSAVCCPDHGHVAALALVRRQLNGLLELAVVVAPRWSGLETTSCSSPTSLSSGGCAAPAATSGFGRARRAWQAFRPGRNAAQSRAAASEGEWCGATSWVRRARRSGGSARAMSCSFIGPA